MKILSDQNMNERSDNKYNSTPLMVACNPSIESFFYMEQLLLHGASMDLVDDEDDTALNYALYNTQEERIMYVTQCLLKHGLSWGTYIHSKENHYKTMLGFYKEDYLRRSKSEDCFEFIEKYLRLLPLFAARGETIPLSLPFEISKYV